jgi:hypothetical protein
MRTVYLNLNKFSRPWCIWTKPSKTEKKGTCISTSISDVRELLVAFCFTSDGRAPTKKMSSSCMTCFKIYCHYQTLASRPCHQMHFLVNGPSFQSFLNEKVKKLPWLLAPMLRYNSRRLIWKWIFGLLMSGGAKLRDSTYLDKLNVVVHLAKITVSPFYWL